MLHLQHSLRYAPAVIGKIREFADMPAYLVMIYTMC